LRPQLCHFGLCGLVLPRLRRPTFRPARLPARYPELRDVLLRHSLATEHRPHEQVRRSISTSRSPFPPTGIWHYYISLAATSPAAASTNCSLIQVTATSTTLASCVRPARWLLLRGPMWTRMFRMARGIMGPRESNGFRLRAAIHRTCSPLRVTSIRVLPTRQPASVCTENNTNVDLISGPTATAVTTINSSANNYASSRVETAITAESASTLPTTRR